LFKDETIVARQRALFKQLCNAKERSVIYKTAKVGGYLSVSNGLNNCIEGWDPIFEFGYQYAECTTASMSSHDLPENAEIYNFTLMPEGHSDCLTGEKHFTDYSRRTYNGNSPNYKDTNLGDNYKKEHQDKLAGKCLVAKKIDKPKSQYMYLNTGGYYDEEEKLFYDMFDKKYKGHERTEKKGLIGYVDKQIIDMQTGEVLAKNSNYTFFPKGRLWSVYKTQDCSERKEIRPPDILKSNTKY
jgi:hypothetical protein